MSRNVARRLKLSNVLRPPTVQTNRTLHASSQCHFAATLGQLVDPLYAPAVKPVASPMEKLRRRRYQDLEAVLGQEDPNPAQVWGMYVDLLGLVGPEYIPLEMHQRVLRKSTLPPAAARADLYQRLGSKRRPRAPHIHEVRYQAIVNNMREGGHAVEMDDYHFILEQFAAVGHHVGATQVLQEMTYLRVPKTHKTYSLCLMALCHRLSLPIWHADREKMVEAMTKICLKLVNEMWADKIPITSYNVDLTLRVLKETMDYEAFQKLLSMSYAIDLSYPDRPPLEFWDKPATNDTSDSNNHPLPIQQPFSTSALNTTLDFLGRLGNVSKLIQAFEVLTTPLSSKATSNLESAFADDADEDFGVNNPEVAPYTHPSAEPNTTSFQLMIKWLCRHGHISLARHYVVHAMEKDRLVDRHLRGECLRKRKGEILAPHLGITQYMFLPMLGEANRDNNTGLLRFLLRKVRRALRRKRVDIVFYGEIQRQWESAARQETQDAVEASVANLPENNAASVASSSSAPTWTAPASHTSSSPSSSSSDTLIQIPYEPVPEPSAPTQASPKVFDVNLHMAILKRDLYHLEALEKRVMDALGRKVQRLKERLTRRIWAGKNVYVRSSGRRIRVSRGYWRGAVRFRETRALPDSEVVNQERGHAMQIHMRPGSVAAQQGFFTPSSPWAERLRHQQQQQTTTSTSS